MKDKSAEGLITAYIKNFPDDVQEILNKIRNLIQETAPEAVEKFSYQMPTYDYHGNLVHFAAYKKHIGFYPTPSGITAFKEQLSKFKNAKGSVQFPLNEPLPYDLIREIVLFRVNENGEKAAKKR